MIHQQEQPFRKQNTELKKKLAEKAKEIQIESSLERVRVAAMKMKSRNDMVKICKTISQQLQKLGVKEIRNVQTAIFYPQKEPYMNYLFFAKHNKEIIDEAVSANTNNKIFKNFVTKMQNGKGGFFKTHLKGEKVKEWLAWQKKSTNQFPDRYLLKAGHLCYYWYSLGVVALGISTYYPLIKKEQELFKRFMNVFELSYRRFLDIEKAEAQAREAQIQLALERVRAKTMAMQKSEELKETTLVLFQQFKSLGATTAQASICIFDEELKMGEMYLTLKGEKIDRSFPMELDKEVFVMKKAKKAFLNKQKNFFCTIKGKELQNYNQWRNSFISRKAYDESNTVRKQSWNVNAVFFSGGMMAISSNTPASDDALKLLERFANVFDLAYTRFNDLKKAEAQARESQIQLALERVRAKTNAMHKSKDLLDVITLLADQFQLLGFKIHSANFNTSYREKDWNLWLYNPGTIMYPDQIRIPYLDNPFFNRTLESIAKGFDFTSFVFTKKEKDGFLDHLYANTIAKNAPEERKKFSYSAPGFAWSTAYLKNTALTITNYDAEPYTEEQNMIIRRFGNVFEQSYTRFLDLQKAEAQAREAQIQLALERVRARAMAMQTSEELGGLIGTLFSELTKLDLALTRCTIWIMNPKTNDVTWWMANSEDPLNPASYFIPYNETPAFLAFMNEWKNRTTKWVYDLKGQTKKDWDNYLFSKTGLSKMPDFIKDGMRAPDRVLLSASFNNFGAINLATLAPLPDEHFNILLRFAKVFDLTYTRFNDLKQAEAQVRESQIQLALERVRARTMAMQHSDELSETVYILFQQFRELGKNPDQATIGVINEDEKIIEYWVTMYGKSINKVFKFSLDEPNVTNKIYKAWKENKKSLVIDLSGNALAEFMKYRADKGGAAINLDEKRRIINVAFFSKGLLNVQSTIERSEESIKLLERFASVFEQTYTRFLDLQKAEEQTRESQIQLALERVRARTMAMQHSDELAETASVLFQQMNALGNTPERLNIGVINEDKGFVETWATEQGGNQINHSFNARLDEPTTIAKLYKGWKAKKTSMMVDISGNELKQWIRFLQNELKMPVNEEILQNRRVQTVAYFKEGFILMTTPEPVPAETISLLERFAEVFNLTYTRFLDLQKAEAQAREAKIEASLEKVRSRSMGMQKSDELKEVIRVVYEQFIHLNIHIEHTGFIMDYKERDDLHIWLADKHLIPSEVTIPCFDSTPNNSIKESKEKGQDFFKYLLAFEEKNKFYHDLFRFVPGVPEETLEYYFNCPGLAGSGVLLDNVGLYIENFDGISYTDEENKILMRFGKVFQQTYTRFLDLQKAEAQAREAQIEAALERVRARTMAMHQSNELSATALLLFQQLQHLGLVFARTGIYIWGKDVDLVEGWTSNGSLDKILPSLFLLFKEDKGHREIYEASLKGESTYEQVLTGEELKKHYQWLMAQPTVPGTLRKVNESDYVMPEAQYKYAAIFKKGYLLLIAETPQPEACELLKKFANVFEQTYTRFLDLQKAEAQAREAQIEVALERVRAQSMAMSKSKDLALVVSSVFIELEKLDVKTLRCGIGIINGSNKNVKTWITTASNIRNTVELSGDEPLTGHALLETIFTNWKAQKSFSYTLEGNDLINYYKTVGNTDFQEELAKEVLSNSNVKHFYHCVMFPAGGLFAFSETPFSDETYRVLKRFGDAFYHAYKRFEDLQRAEAQAREAKIEAALERVRGKAMAMHNSEDLTETIHVFYHEIELLSVTPRRCGVGLLSRESHIVEISTMSTTEEGKPIEVIGKMNLEGHPVLDGIYNNWLNQKEYHPVLRGHEIKEYYKLIRSQISYPDYPNDVAQYGYFFYFPEGGVFAWTEKELPEDELLIYRRFTSVLSLTYKRYKDIQTAEANAKEAIKQAALDRIRADIASMRTTKDLERITPLIWNELNILSVPFIRCGVFIMDDEQQLIHTFLSTPDGKAIAAFHLLYNTPGNIAQVLSNWQQKKNYIDHWNEQTFTEFAHTLVKQGALSSVDEYMKTLPAGGFYLHFLPFLQGMLYVGNTGKLADEEINLLQSVADAFSTAYSRYEDFNKLEAAKKQVDSTLTELQSTQKQLIQSEKMASLGELTAGIAHEIQNPLNFVNNFSDVNKELLEEMKDEMEKGNLEEVKTIANDIIENEGKINHHGKRADAIVKGMLQHSRKSSGQKEPTDINALADEYLRLSYHGLRAKDKTFNAEMKTDFDPSLSADEAGIGKVNIIPQDIGRVLLNLFNNAFYAVNEQKSRNPNSYEPIVSVSTSLNPPAPVPILSGEGREAVTITVSDNGNGIPKNIVDKIFQPFFTTKPTGEGTGLGLSLAYDIIKVHGGTLKVETKEGEGSEFVIQLPVV